MFTKEEIETAIKVINQVSGEPSVGIIADLIKDIRNASAPVIEKRVTSAEEKR